MFFIHELCYHCNNIFITNWSNFTFNVLRLYRKSTRKVTSKVNIYDHQTHIWMKSLMSQAVRFFQHRTSLFGLTRLMLLKNSLVGRLSYSLLLSG